MAKKLDPKEKARRAREREKAREKSRREKERAKEKARQAPKAPKGSRVVKTPSGKTRVIRPFKRKAPVDPMADLKAWLKRKGWGLYEQDTFFDGALNLKQQNVSGFVPQLGEENVWWAAKVFYFREKPRDAEGFHEGTEVAAEAQKGQGYTRYNGKIGGRDAGAFEHMGHALAWHDSPQVLAGSVATVIENAANRGGWELDGLTLQVAWRASGTKPPRLT